jgi:sulfate adenylyltransferase subunit 1 (EFTu-like GTPase family)
MEALSSPPESFVFRMKFNTPAIASEPYWADHFQDNPKTGAFILIDPETYQTAAAGMIRGVA